MENVNPYKSFFATVLIFIGILTIVYIYFPKFFDSDFSVALVTFLVGVLIIYLYIKQQEDNKKDAAKIILQEIRRAENVISDYKEHGYFKFTKKIIATDSWSKNINCFVEELNPDEIDKISSLYSTGKYLDTIISKVSDVRFDQRIQSDIKNQVIQQAEQQIQPFIQQLKNNQSTAGDIQHGAGDLSIQSIDPRPIKIDINIGVGSWDILFKEIVDKYESIYYTSIAEKLKRIAKIK